MTVLTYDGTPLDGVFIESETNPWVEVAGQPVDWTTVDHITKVTCPCGDSQVFVEGVLEAMDTPEGIQRCDTCDIYDGDLDAALALARLVGGTVKFYAENTEEQA